MQVMQHHIFSAFKAQWKLIALLGVVPLVIIVLVIASYIAIRPYGQYVIAPQDAPKQQVGIVFGAGITADGKPFKELQSRLDTAANAYDDGLVETLLLSGDNRFDHYDEPTAMYDYLVQQRGIPAEDLVRDYAGRSTYETCERAAKIFKVEQATLFSAGSHLPRAIYLCRHFGITAYGISSSVEANNSTRRELLARVKAVYNANIHGEPTVLGEPIPLN